MVNNKQGYEGEHIEHLNSINDPCPFYIPHNITYPIVRQQHKDFVKGCVKNPNMNVNVVETRDTFEKEL